ncbi:hypothetical protein EC968_008370 [Mortierella alpina]|nr:hypothetical protein EC968_008370 [Mortierella alpina]
MASRQYKRCVQINSVPMPDDDNTILSTLRNDINLPQTQSSDGILPLLQNEGVLPQAHVDNDVEEDGAAVGHLGESYDGELAPEARIRGVEGAKQGGVNIPKAIIASAINIATTGATGTPKQY